MTLRQSVGNLTSELTGRVLLLNPSLYAKFHALQSHFLSTLLTCILTTLRNILFSVNGLVFIHNIFSFTIFAYYKPLKTLKVVEINM